MKKKHFQKTTKKIKNFEKQKTYIFFKKKLKKLENFQKMKNQKKKKWK